MSESSVPFRHPWPERMVVEVGSVTVGGTPSTNVPEYWGGAIPWMASGDVHRRVIDDVPTRITGLGLRHSSAVVVDPPSVAVALAGQGRTRGTAAYVRCALCTNQSVALLKGNSGELDTGYLLHNLSYRYSELRSRSAGGGRAGLTKTILEQLPLPVPTAVPEQSKIAEVLSTVDWAIEMSETLIAKQRRVQAGLVHDLLTRGIDEGGNVRSERTHKFKDSPVGRIPVEWESASLAVFVPSAEYGISSSLGESGYPVLRMNNLLDGETELSDLKFTDAPVPEHLWLRDSDVLFNRTNSWDHVGRTGIWRSQVENATFASYLVRLNPHPDKLLPEMLNFWLNWEPVQIAMRRQATPAVQQVNINPTNLRSIPAAFPRNLDEQTAIAIRISASREVISACGEHLRKLKSMKAGLMHDLLTGHRRVTALLEQSEGHNVSSCTRNGGNSDVAP